MRLLFFLVFFQANGKEISRYFFKVTFHNEITTILTGSTSKGVEIL